MLPLLVQVVTPPHHSDSWSSEGAPFCSNNLAKKVLDFLWFWGYNYSMKGEYYEEYDEFLGYWVVYYSESNRVYGSYSDQAEAKARVKELTENRRNFFVKN